MSRRIHDTDDYVLGVELRDRLKSCCEEVDGCLIFNPPEGQRQIIVELRGKTGGRIVASVMRVAYALAYPREHVTAGELVTNLCGKKGDHAGRGACVHPEHLVKGSVTEVNRFTQSKPKGRAA